MDSSKINSSKNKAPVIINKMNNNRGVGESEYDEAEPNVTFSNVNKELKDFILKLSKESISKLYFKRKFYRYKHQLLHFNSKAY